MNKRVVITGMSGVTSLGHNADDIFANLKKYKNAVVNVEEWQRFKGLHTHLGAPVQNLDFPDNFDRKNTRSMGPVSKMATMASQNALIDAGLIDNEVIRSGECGVSYGSCAGSTQPVLPFTNLFTNNEVKGISATTYIKMMPHTTPVNIALFFGLKGRVITTSSACTSGSQGIGYAFEAIKYGQQKIMLAGGAEELCPSMVAVFDTLYATSVKNDQPNMTPRPFDKARDGLVLGEGAGTLILEEYDHAVSRGAKIYGEIVGYATNCDAQHITRPSSEDMEKVMRMALASANLSADDIGYVNAHGTSTDAGDIAESKATQNIFGTHTPFSSLKSYFGHTLGACGAIETWLSLEMMLRNWFAPTINLEEVDEKCADLDYIREEGRELNIDTIMCNNFAFGGINTSIIIKKVS